MEFNPVTVMGTTLLAIVFAQGAVARTHASIFFAFAVSWKYNAGELSKIIRKITQQQQNNSRTSKMTYQPPT